MSRTCIFLFVIAFCAQEVNAQCYSSHNSYVQPYYNTQYVVSKEYVPVAVPVSYPAVAVPVYSYINAGLTYPVQQTAFPVQQAVYPQMPGYYQQPVYQQQAQQQAIYPQMQGYPQQQASAEQIADIVLRKLQGSQGVQSAPQSQSGGYQQQGNNQRQSNGPPSAQQQQSGGNVAQIFQTKCASCHTGSSKNGGGFAMFNDAGQLLNMNREQRFVIFDQVYGGEMPKGQDSLSDNDVEAIRQWARQR